MGYAIDILNTIRNNASTEYASRVPQATRENITAVGRNLAEYDNIYNEFVTTLLHKIGKTIVTTALFENKLKKFKAGKVLTGQDIEDIFVASFRTAEGAYDPNGGMGDNGVNPFKRRDYQDTTVYYYRMNRRDKYVITLYKDDVIRAFNSETALEAFITAQFNSLYAGAELDEYEHMKKLLAEGIKNKAFFSYLVPEIGKTGATDADNTSACKAFARTVKKAVADVSYASTQYNSAGVKKATKKNNLVLFINKDIAPHLDVDLYSVIFGADYAKLGIEVVELDNFGDDATGTYALLCEDNFFQCYDVKNEMTQLTNPDGLYTNHWLHILQILAYSKFATAVRFGTAEVGA